MGYFTGKGYGVSNHLDVTGVPLLTWQDPETGKEITLFDRVAVQVDPTIKQPLHIDQIDGGRMDKQTSAALKQAVGGTSTDELDHIISLELGGSNQIANLGLDAFTQGTKNNPTDTYENQLSAAVQAGSMSLVDAWHAEAKAKNKVLAEDLKVRTNDNWATAAAGALGAIQGLTGFKSIGDINQNLEAQIKQDFETIAQKPFDLPTRTRIFTEQIDLTAEQLNLSKEDAAAYVKVYTARYAQTNNIDPRELLGSFTANEQQLLKLSGVEPDVLGINVSVWSNVAMALTIGQGILVTAGIVGGIALMFLGGPEVIASAGAEGAILAFLRSLGITGFSIKLVSFGTFLYEALGSIASRIPMITKQMMDSKYIIPSLIATSLNDDVKNIKSLTKGSTPTSPPVAAPGARSSAAPASPTKLFVGHITEGVLSSATPLSLPIETSIRNGSELAAAAANVVSAFLSGLPSIFSYRIHIKDAIQLPDGTEAIGSVVRVPTRVTKKGIQHYKDIKNQFAVIEVFAKKQSGQFVHIDELVLGPVDETAGKPTPQELADLSNQLTGKLVTSSMASVTHIQLPSTPTSPVAAPAAPSAALAVQASAAPTAPAQTIMQAGQSTASAAAPEAPVNAGVQTAAPSTPSTALTPTEVVLGDHDFAFKSGDTVVVTNTNGKGLNVRAVASLQGAILLAAPEGAEMTVTGFWTDADEYKWWPVLYQAHRGYVAGQFLRKK